jgi:hypothetical protein
MSQLCIENNISGKLSFGSQVLSIPKDSSLKMSLTHAYSFLIHIPVPIQKSAAAYVAEGNFPI